MSVEAAINAILLADPGVAAVVASRIYPVVMPEDPTLPAITYQRIDGPRETSLDLDSSLAHPRIQVSAWGNAYADVKNAADAVREALNGFSGTIAGFTIQGIVIESDNDLYDPQTRTYHVATDFEVWHLE